MGRAHTSLLLLLTVFAPISMSLYLPVLPALTHDLETSTSIGQLTLTACLVGLGAGQLVAGPLSDRHGRRRPLVVGIVAYIGASAACAAAPTIEVLLAARLVQGLAGSVGIVIAQASGRDVYEGRALTLFYGRLTVLGGLAAVVGPVLGGQLARLTQWRGVFVLLILVGLLLLVLTLRLFRETLPARRDDVPAAAGPGPPWRVLLADRDVVAGVLVRGFTYASLFAYLAGATFLLQGSYGLSPQGYAAAFALNSAGFMVFGHLGGRLAARWSVHGSLAVGLVMCGAGAAGLLATGLIDVPLWMVLASLFVHASGIAASSPATTTLALAGHPEAAGAASSVLGVAQFGFGSVAAPVVGLGGDVALSLGLTTSACVVCAVVVQAALLRSRTTVI